MSAHTRSALVSAISTFILAEVNYRERPGISTEVDHELAASNLDEALADFERSIKENNE